MCFIKPYRWEKSQLLLAVTSLSVKKKKMLVNSYCLRTSRAVIQHYIHSIWLLVGSIMFGSSTACLHLANCI